MTHENKCMLYLSVVMHQGTIHSWVIILGAMLQSCLYFNTTYATDFDPFWVYLVLVFSLILGLYFANSNNNSDNDDDRESISCSDIGSMMLFKTADYASNTTKFDIWAIICYFTASLCQMRVISGNSVSFYIGSLDIFYLLIIISVLGYLIILLAFGNRHLRGSHVVGHIVVGLVLTQIMSIVEHIDDPASLDWVYCIILIIVSIIIVVQCLWRLKRCHVLIIVATMCLISVGMIVNSKTVKSSRTKSDFDIGDVSYITFWVLLVTSSIIIEALTGIRHHQLKTDVANNNDRDLADIHIQLPRVRSNSSKDKPNSPSEASERSELSDASEAGGMILILNEFKAQYFNVNALCSILQTALILIPCRVLCMNIGDVASGVYIGALIAKMIVLCIPRIHIFQNLGNKLYRNSDKMHPIGYVFCFVPFAVVLLDAYYGIFLLTCIFISHWPILFWTFKFRATTMVVSLTIVGFCVALAFSFYILELRSLLTLDVTVMSNAVFGLSIYCFTLFLLHWIGIKRRKIKQEEHKNLIEDIHNVNNTQFEDRTWISITSIIFLTGVIITNAANGYDQQTEQLYSITLYVFETIIVCFCMFYLLTYLNDMNNNTAFDFHGASKMNHETIKLLNKYVNKTSKILSFLVFSLIFITIPIYIELKFLFGINSEFDIIQFVAIILFVIGFLIYGIIISFNASPTIVKSSRFAILFIILKACAALAFIKTKGISLYLTLFIWKIFCCKTFKDRRKFYMVYVVGCGLLVLICYFDELETIGGDPSTGSDWGSFAAVNAYSLIVFAMDRWYFIGAGKDYEESTNEKDTQFFWKLRLALGLLSCMTSNWDRLLIIVMTWCYIAGPLICVRDFLNTRAIGDKHGNTESLSGLTFLAVGVVIASVSNQLNDLIALRVILILFGVFFIFVALGTVLRQNAKAICSICQSCIEDDELDGDDDNNAYA